jgi:hypothetical protein
MMIGGGRCVLRLGLEMRVATKAQRRRMVLSYSGTWISYNRLVDASVAARETCPNQLIANVIPSASSELFAVMIPELLLTNGSSAGSSLAAHEDLR